MSRCVRTLCDTNSVSRLQCDPGYGAEAFYDLMYRKPQLIMLVATSCSEVAKTLGEIVSYWNLLLVSADDQVHIIL